MSARANVPLIRVRKAQQVEVGDRVFVDDHWWRVTEITDYSGIRLFYGHLGMIWSGAEHKRIKVMR